MYTIIYNSDKDAVFKYISRVMFINHAGRNCFGFLSLLFPERLVAFATADFSTSPVCLLAQTLTSNNHWHFCSHIWQVQCGPFTGGKTVRHYLSALKPAVPACSLYLVIDNLKRRKAKGQGQGVPRKAHGWRTSWSCLPLTVGSCVIVCPRCPPYITDCW